MKSLIREWIETHQGGDGDFCVADRALPFAVIPPTLDTETVLYCTKTSCLGRLAYQLGRHLSFAAVMRTGLPSDEDVDWLRALVGSRKLVFLGDADPFDLMVFAWLRESLPIEYVGLCDQLFVGSGVELHGELTIQLSRDETAALPLVNECLSDLRSLLGEECSELLTSGYKLEMEAMFNFANRSPVDLQTALMGS